MIREKDIRLKTIRENDFRLNDVSGKWRSAKYQFDNMEFDII